MPNGLPKPEMEELLRRRLKALYDVDLIARRVGAKLVLEPVDDEGPSTSDHRNASSSSRDIFLRRDDAMALVRRTYREKPPVVPRFVPSDATSNSSSHQDADAGSTADATSISTSTRSWMMPNRSSRRAPSYRDSDLDSLRVHSGPP